MYLFLLSQVVPWIFLYDAESAEIPLQFSFPDTTMLCSIPSLREKHFAQTLCAYQGHISQLCTRSIALRVSPHAETPYLDYRSYTGCMPQCATVIATFRFVNGHEGLKAPSANGGRFARYAVALASTFHLQVLVMTTMIAVVLMVTRVRVVGDTQNPNHGKNSQSHELLWRNSSREERENMSRRGRR